ncbi:MAG TPA: hypothetical protein VMB81_01690 [Candidatus Sulfotelmatobacter sp.]|nr:hypothetical protein [Candidatus Sulfotelmatobacter sp.]
MIKELDMAHDHVLQPPEALSAGRALAVWLGLSLLGWGAIAALVLAVV